MNFIPSPDKLNPEDWLFVEKQPVVVCRIKRDVNPVEIAVVYQKNGLELFAKAIFENGRWVFYEKGRIVGDKPELDEYLNIIREGWWWDE